MTFSFGFGRLLLSLSLASIGAGFVVACGPAPHHSTFLSDSPNQTGFQAADGKNHTGAGADKELDKIKTEIAGDSTVAPALGAQALSKADRDLAARILSARLEKATTAALKVRISLREAGIVIFDFTDAQIVDKSAPEAAKDSTRDVRYKAVVGKSATGEATTFELALLCRKAAFEAGKPAPFGCRIASLALRDRYGSGAKAGLVIRNQETLVLAKAPKGKPVEKHETLKRLMTNFKTAKSGTMQSFEVAWGPSGFALEMGDAQVCPVGRLVETNELDEPLRLNCAGTPEFRDLEGRMIGNTTRGELFLELQGTTPRFLYGETNETVYLLVRQKREPKKIADPLKPGTKVPESAPGTPSSVKTPGTGAAATPPGNAPASPDNSTNEDDDDGADDTPIFEDEVPVETVVSGPGKTEGWLIPVVVNSPTGRTWARDRKNPLIEKRVKEWLGSPRLANFAVHFMPNRNLVLGKLAAQGVPAEFAYMTFVESEFFLQGNKPKDLYRVQTSGMGAVGAWQFMPRTGRAYGLRVYTDRNLNPCDDRADLAKSSAAAALYLRKLIKMFPQDPKLVVAGYNQGEYGVDGNLSSLKKTTSEKRMKVVSELGLTYWALRKLQMAPAETIGHVEKFVGAYHAALEMKPVAANPSVQPWRPNPQCR